MSSPDWRQSKKLSNVQSCKSRGVSPQKFHNVVNLNTPQDYGTSSKSPKSVDSSSSFNPVKQGQSVIRRMRVESRRRNLSEWNKEQECKRSEYRKLTECSTFPLQQYAIDRWQRLQLEYMNNNLSSTHDDLNNCDEGNLTGNSTSGSSCLLDPEPKRQLHSTKVSPCKSIDRHRFQDEFIGEQKLVQKLGNEHSILKISESSSIESAGTENRGLCELDMQRRKEMKELGERPALWSMQPRLWGKESTTNGKRKYVAAHAGRFFDWYWRKCGIRDRHCYELILDQVPCRLYLDIEFSKISNPSIDATTAEKLLDELYEELVIEIREVFGASSKESHDECYLYNNTDATVSCAPLERHHIVDLDSSTESKFSRHWIVHIPLAFSSDPNFTSTGIKSPANNFDNAKEALFRDSVSAGRFMSNFIGRLTDQQAVGTLEHQRPHLHKHLFVSTGRKLERSRNVTIFPSAQRELTDSSGEEVSSDFVEGNLVDEVTCFVDTGVYTRNRLFRLLGSSKFGKPPSAALRIADANMFPFPSGFDNTLFYLPHMERHMVGQENLNKPAFCRTDNPPLQRQEETHINDTKTPSLENTPNDLNNKMDWNMHAEALACTLVIPLNVFKLDFAILPSPGNCQSFHPSEPVRNSSHTRSTKLSLCSFSRGLSPYPMLDDFVQNTLAQRQGLHGSIQSWFIKYAEPVHTNHRLTNCETTKKPIRISYTMVRNRWCECVGRAHRSNNILWNVDLTGPPFCCYQTCWDIECQRQNFRGSLIPLPHEVSEGLQDALFEEMLNLYVESQQPVVSKVDNLAEENDLDDSFEKALASLNLDEIVCSSEVSKR